MPDAQKKPQFRAIEDIAFDMGLYPSDATRLVAEHNAPIERDPRGRDSVPVSFIQTVMQTKEYVAARNKAFAENAFGRSSDPETVSATFRNRRLSLLSRYTPFIESLESIHKKYLRSAHRDGFETSAMAQYLLLSRAIATLRALHASLEEGHWYSYSLVRDIDECLDLAHFFLATEGTDKGKRACLRWFREGQHPSHKECREEVSSFQAKVLPDVNEQEHLEMLAELYRKKSKFTHPSFTAIRDMAQLGANDSGAFVSAVSYGPNVDERKLYDSVDFFRSSIWSTAQLLCISLCKSIGVSQQDAETLLAMDRMFGEWERRSS